MPDINTLILASIKLAIVIPGIIAVFIIVSAKRRMSNPELLRYMHFTILAVASYSLFALWHAARESFGLKDIYGPLIEVPEYLLAIISCIFLLVGAMAIYQMSKQYGFNDRGEITRPKK